MRYFTRRQRFYGAWDAMILIYTQYPTITPVTEEQIEHDLIAYLEKHGTLTDDWYSDDEKFTIVDPEYLARVILQEVKEALQHD